MTADKPKPPTEAELAAIKARCVAIGDPSVQSHPTSDAAAMAIAQFCATAAHDLPALLAAIEERDLLEALAGGHRGLGRAGKAGRTVFVQLLRGGVKP